MSEDPGPNTLDAVSAGATLRTQHPSLDPAILLEVDRDVLTLGRTLGRGGMCEVVAAHQAVLDREVAVKMVLPEQRSVDANAYLLQEAWVTAALDHPNIIPIHDVRIDDAGQPQIVLKRVDGVAWSASIDDRLRPDRLGRNLRILVEVCRAVEYAHGKGILHRDLKPSNVMIGPNDEVYVVDWGLAAGFTERTAGRIPHVSDPGGILGTPAYMAPEQVRQEPADVRTDVYLAGGLLYRILARKPPHTTRGRGVIQEILTVDPPLAGEWPEGLRDLLARALARERSRRPATLRAFREELELWLEHRGAEKLVDRADQTAAELREAIDTGQEARVIHDLFGAARFGYQAAIEARPVYPRAQAGLRDLLVGMVRYSLEAGDESTAVLLVDQLVDPPDDLEERVRAAKERKDRTWTELRSLQRDHDPTTAWRWRVITLTTLGFAWVSVPVLTSLVMGTEPTIAKRVVSNIALLMVTALVLIPAAPGLLQSSVNRRVMALVALAPALGIPMSLGLGLAGVDPHLAHPMQLFVFGSITAFAATSLNARLLPAVLVWFGSFFIAVTNPELSRPLAILGAIFLAANGALVAWWSGRRR
ncbi:MAG: serine/threonine protein kinase [Alphaproteobacteria bacterium]|nr:serine/threonine protein kinase [Alphaproteobacteria bacterium]